SRGLRCSPAERVRPRDRRSETPRDKSTVTKGNGSKVLGATVFPRPGHDAKRMECVELAPAVGHPRRSKAGASSTHSIRFASFGDRLTRSAFFVWAGNLLIVSPPC